MHRKDQAEEWKIQAKWASWESIRHSILLGTINLIMTALFWGTLTSYVLNGGPKSSVYFNISDYGWTWFILQYPIAFIYQVMNNIDELEHIFIHCLRNGTGLHALLGSSDLPHTIFVQINTQSTSQVQTAYAICRFGCSSS